MDQVLSPEMQLKRSTMEAAYRLRKGSPDFRNALRERCRHQVKARRSALFDNIRNTRSKLNMQETLSEIFSSELNLLRDDMKESQMEICEASKSDNTINHDLEFLDQIKHEIIQEQESWILAEYEKYLENEFLPVDPNLEENVACPLCLRCLLVRYSHAVQCPNGCIALPSHWALSDIYQAFQYSLHLHDSNCLSNAQFMNFLENEVSGLHLICHDCGFFHRVLSVCT